MILHVKQPDGTYSKGRFGRETIRRAQAGGGMVSSPPPAGSKRSHEAGNALLGASLQAVEPPAPKLCPCGCGRTVVAKRPWAQYATPACRQKMHKRRARQAKAEPKL